MTNRGPLNGSHSPLSEPASDDPKRIGQRTRKMVIGIIAITTPIELVLAITQYYTDPMAQMMTFGILPLLAFSYIMNAQQLTRSLDDGDKLFQTLIHPVICVLYGALGVTGLVGVVSLLRDGTSSAFAGLAMIMIFGVLVAYSIVNRV